MNKTLKNFLIALAVCAVLLVFLIAASFHRLSTPTDNEAKQAAFLRKIPVPAYMTADFRKIDTGCDFKCANPIDVEFTYSSSTSYTKAMRDFESALISIGYKRGKMRVDVASQMSDYEFTHTDTENNCSQILVHQYHDLHHLEAACHLRRVNINL